MSPAEQSRATLRAIGRFFAFWFYLCPVRAFGLALNHVLSLLLGGILISVSLYVSLPMLASWVGKEEALHEAHYIKHGIVALALATVVLLILFIIVAPASMYWEEHDRADNLDPGPKKTLLHRLLRWISDRAGSVDSGALIVLQEDTFRLIEAAFGRSKARAMVNANPLPEFYKVVFGHWQGLEQPFISTIDEMADHPDDPQPDFDVHVWHNFQDEHQKHYRERLVGLGKSIYSGFSNKPDDPDWGYREKLKNIEPWANHVENELSRSGCSLDRVKLPDLDSMPRTNESLNEYITAVLSVFTQLVPCTRRSQKLA